MNAPTNQDIAQRLEQIGQMLELLGEDSFRAAANARAARAIGDAAETIAGKGKPELLAIEGVGPKIADKVLEFVATGRMVEHEELRARVPAGLLALLGVPGLGPKTVRMMWNEANVTDLAGLKRIIEDGSILKLPRMGAKSVEKIKQSLAFAAEGNTRPSIGLVMPLAEAVAARLGEMAGVKQVQYAGSLRRGKETVGDVDILVCAPGHEQAVAEGFVKLPGVTQVLAQGERKCSVRMTREVGGGRERGGEEDAGPTIQVDIRLVPEASWGAALMYFTGSKEHNVKLRQRALDMGLTLNEYGLFPEDKDERPPQERGVKAVAGKSEAEVYKALKLPNIPPELREDRGEFGLKQAPALIELSDIKAELHAHTRASDGAMTIEQLAAAAKMRGFHTIAVTDHSKSSFQANGLSVERMLEHVKAVHAARTAVKGIQILAGSEVDILSDGSLDYPDEVLAEMDIVIASPHAALTQEPGVATKRLLKAIANPYVRILGHPTGRLINRRAGLNPDMKEVISAAKAHNVALEINAHWMRLDLRDTHVKAAVEAGCLIAIDCDVHAMEDFENLRYGVMTGRRGWLTKEACVNTWDARRLGAWINAKSGRG